MNRADWLAEQRRQAEEGYNTRWAPLYGEKYGLYPNATHLEFMRRYLSRLPQGAELLDAACGAGRYMPLLLEAGGRHVTGIDQSQGMLDRAQARFPGVRFEKTGLQELAFAAAFDGITCMDAMENVPPEDWPRVLGNFQRALKPGGVLYFTVEQAEEADIARQFQAGQQAGLPLVYGESIEEPVYHFWPRPEQVRAWLRQANLEIIQEGPGDGYHHFIVRAAT